VPIAAFESKLPSRAAGDVWLASKGDQDPSALVNDAFDLIEHGLAYHASSVSRSVSGAASPQGVSDVAALGG
jgi:hypothetical protein